MAAEVSEVIHQMKLCFAGKRKLCVESLDPNAGE